VKFIEMLDPECKKKKKIKILQNVTKPLLTDRVMSRKNGIFKNDFDKNNVIYFGLQISLFLFPTMFRDTSEL
jgi:hypothetical protein